MNPMCSNDLTGIAPYGTGFDSGAARDKSSSHIAYQFAEPLSNDEDIRLKLTTQCGSCLLVSLENSSCLVGLSNDRHFFLINDLEVLLNQYTDDFGFARWIRDNLSSVLLWNNHHDAWLVSKSINQVQFEKLIQQPLTIYRHVQRNLNRILDGFLLNFCFSDESFGVGV